MTGQYEKLDKLFANFEKVLHIIQENAPEGINFCFAVNVRDTTRRTKDYPDGVCKNMAVFKGTMYDKIHFKSLIDNL